MSLNMVLLIVGVIVGISYFAKRNHRKQKELKMQTRRGR